MLPSNFSFYIYFFLQNALKLKLLNIFVVLHKITQKLCEYAPKMQVEDGKE